MQDNAVMFFGGRDWERVADDLQGIPANDKPLFVLCLFMVVLTDQCLYTHFPDGYPRWRRQTGFPKFGWAGFGPHNENPLKILSAAEREGEIVAEEVIQIIPEFVAFMIEEVQDFFQANLPGIESAAFFEYIERDGAFAYDEGKIVRCFKQEFSPEYPYYVYVYMDPLHDDEVFYVGKGSGGRIDAHMSQLSDKHNTEKQKRIQAIVAGGEQPLRLIVGRYKTEKEAFAVEATMIHWVYGKSSLTNISSGHNHLHIREIGNHERIVPRLEIQRERERANDGLYTKRIDDSRHKYGIPAKLSDLQASMVKAGYSFQDVQCASQDTWIALPLKNQSLFSIVINMKANKTARVNVSLKLVDGRTSSIDAFREYLIGKLDALNMERDNIRGFSSNSSTEPKWFTPDGWGLLDSVEDIEELMNRIDWFRTNFRLQPEASR